MAKDRPLRAVQPGEKPSTPATPKTISEAVESGSGRDVLASMRAALAQKLDANEVSSNAIASAYKELRELDRLIRAADLQAAAEGEASSESKQRRTYRPTAI